MTEWKMHNMENNRKLTPWRLLEKVHPENGRMENAQHRN